MNFRLQGQASEPREYFQNVLPRAEAEAAAAAAAAEKQQLRQGEVVAVKRPEEDSEGIEGTKGGGRGMHRPLQCMLDAGETIFVPAGWWHTVLNTEDTVAVTENFMNDGNAAQVLGELGKRRGLHGAPDGCVEELRRAWPHLFSS